jgi:hypothetical protein
MVLSHREEVPVGLGNLQFKPIFSLKKHSLLQDIIDIEPLNKFRPEYICENTESRHANKLFVHQSSQQHYSQ